MELGLSLGNNLGLCMDLGLKKGSSPPSKSSSPSDKLGEDQDDLDHTKMNLNLTDDIRREKVGSPSDPSLRLRLHPLSPVPAHTQPPPLRFPWLADNLSSEPGSSDGGPGSRVMELNRRRTEAEVEAEGEEQSSPNSGTSSFMEFTTSTRKKLRLSKQQSAFLEHSFTEHHTLNPKQKLELAKQLNLRPRQVEVWFQNRRARTKLKQTEVDCEYLKRCCETLTEENRRLQKELQELRALKTSQPFFMSLPPTTLTMCPSCERVVPTSTSVNDSVTTLSLGKPKPPS